MKFSFFFVLFSFGQIDELGRIIVNLVNVVPGGIVCFLPSYEYESLVFSHFMNRGVIRRIENKKKVTCDGLSSYK